MAEEMMQKCSSRSTLMDPSSGFCSLTKVFHSLRAPVPLPDLNLPLSSTDYVFSLLQSVLIADPSAMAAVIYAPSEEVLYFADLTLSVRALASSLSNSYSLRRGHRAIVVCPPSLHLPVICLSLLSLGVVIAPVNPLATEPEIAHMIGISKPTVAFASSAVASKLPALPLGTIRIDSLEFKTLISRQKYGGTGNASIPVVVVEQSDPAVIFFSSGTTGRAKGALLTHRSIITSVAGFFYNRPAEEESSRQAVSLLTPPLFHVFGFIMLMRCVAMGETAVFMERFDFETMLGAVGKYRVTRVPVSPPLVLVLAKSDIVDRYDLSSLQIVASGGAPLGRELAEKFAQRFPAVELAQGYGLTESGGAASRTIGLDESRRRGSVGRLSENVQAKIVDPVSGQALPPGKRGELWLRSPTMMKGYVGDEEATIMTLDADGWLKTGDLCYIDSHGFLFVVDRLKELIKYKGYQVPPAELERVLLSNPHVLDAAVIPCPDEEAGEVPMAFVVRKPGSTLTEEEIMDFVANQVSPYKKVRRVAFVGAIPKSPSGKLLRRELVQRIASAIYPRL